jgi:hypothetical protein
MLQKSIMMPLSHSAAPVQSFSKSCAIGAAIAAMLVYLGGNLPYPSLRAKRSNPSRHGKKEWIASSLRSSQ